MAALFDEVFTATSIYDMLFFNIKSVLEYPTLEDLEKEDKELYQRWLYLAKTKYNDKYPPDTKALTVYEQNAVYYPEFSKILAITYATLYLQDGNIKREFKKICNEDERLVIETFMAELQILSSAATKSNPPYFPPLCGHNIISHDIPLLMKRFILLSSKFETSQHVPLILKRCLNIKPWESGIVDTVNVWKFNGYDNMPLMLISDFLKLKKTVDLLPLDELSRYYWENIGQNSKETLDFVALQSATQTNLVIQLMNELRKL